MPGIESGSAACKASVFSLLFSAYPLFYIAFIQLTYIAFLLRNRLLFPIVHRLCSKLYCIFVLFNSTSIWRKTM